MPSACEASSIVKRALSRAHTSIAGLINAGMLFAMLYGVYRANSFV
jgi:hypothetical protein